MGNDLPASRRDPNASEIRVAEVDERGAFVVNDAYRYQFSRKPLGAPAEDGGYALGDVSGRDFVEFFVTFVLDPSEESLGIQSIEFHASIGGIATVNMPVLAMMEFNTKPLNMLKAFR